MGGFKFIGPNFVIQNRPLAPNAPRCRCPGYYGNIDSITEEYLVKNKTQELNLQQLPNKQFAEWLQQIHIGDELRYFIRPKTELDVVRDVNSNFVDSIRFRY